MVIPPLPSLAPDTSNVAVDEYIVYVATKNKLLEMGERLEVRVDEFRQLT